MTMTEKMAEYNMQGFRIIMRIYWDDICVAIFGYISESEFYNDFIKEMDNLPCNGSIKIERRY